MNIVAGECTIFLPRQSYRLPPGANTISQKNYKLPLRVKFKKYYRLLREYLEQFIISLSVAQQLYSLSVTLQFTS